MQVKEKEADLKSAEQRLIEDQERTREQHAEEKKALEKQRILLVRFECQSLNTNVKIF